VLNQQARAHSIDIREYLERNFNYFVAPVRISKLLDYAKQRERERERERERSACRHALDVPLPRIAVMSKYYARLERSNENFQNDRREFRFARADYYSRERFDEPAESSASKRKKDSNSTDPGRRTD